MLAKKEELDNNVNDVQLALEDLDYRISEIESGGSGGGGSVKYIPGDAIEITNRDPPDPVQPGVVQKVLNVLYDNDTLGIRDNKLYVIGGGSGGDFWKINPTHMQQLPEHKTLENYDFDNNAENINVRNIDDETVFIYFPDLTIDLSYDRAQFIEIKAQNPNRTWYLSTSGNQIEIPKIIDSETFAEETVFNHDICSIKI